jgi:hypothetical protein
MTQTHENLAPKHLETNRDHHKLCSASFIYLKIQTDGINLNALSLYQKETNMKSANVPIKLCVLELKSYNFLFTVHWTELVT